MSESCPPTFRRRPAHRVQDGQSHVFTEQAVVEAPFDLRLEGRSYTLLMVSPQNLENLARGFCLSEGLVQTPDQVLAVSLGEESLPGIGPAYFAEVTLPEDLRRAARARRTRPAATSCALCGLESFRDLDTQVPPVPLGDIQVESEVITAAFKAMERGQELFAQTGGTHAAAMITLRGEVLALGEDVGRHNALDKALGQAATAGHDLGACLALLSGRVSYEMAIKVARCGVPLVASVSAATALATDLLDRLGVTLVDFARQGRMNVLTHPSRVTVGGAPLGPTES